MKSIIIKESNLPPDTAGPEKIARNAMPSTSANINSENEEISVNEEKEMETEKIERPKRTIKPVRRFV